MNDAPALATADAGVALGGRGIALAVEAADVVIVRGDLTTLPNLLGLFRRARRVVVANVAIAAAVIAVLATWDLVARCRSRWAWRATRAPRSRWR